MIARFRDVRRCRPAPEWHKIFLAMLPAIVAHARLAFRSAKGQDRGDLIQEVIANSFVAFARLAELGKTELAYPTVLARYAVAQIADGRRVGSRLNIRDASSPYAQKMKHFRLARLDHHNHEENCWSEVLVPDRTATPAELAASRIDFPAWLRRLSPRNRKIAMKLAAGERTGEVARQFKVSEGRISQLRGELRRSWYAFHGEPLEGAPA